MITLITGLPGNGKTLYAIWWLMRRSKLEKRQVYYSGIADLKVPGWIECDPEKWHELPSGSIILVDECQRVFRPRMHGKDVPPHVEAMETHRHKGIDLVLLTQHPMLLDSNCRRLVGQHIHCVRMFGMERSTVHEWSAVKENCDKSRADSIKLQWSYPKEVYRLYKSADLHTHKIKIPWRVVGLLCILVGVPLAIWQFLERRAPGAATAVPFVASPGVMEGQSVGARAGGGTGKLTTAEYVQQHAPRVAGLAYTAPVYDGVTTPAEAPYPAACVASAARCVCYTQQATRLDMAEELCRRISDRGFFVAWKGSTQGQRQEHQSRQLGPREGLVLQESGPVVIDLGGVPNGPVEARGGQRVAPTDRQPEKKLGSRS